MLDRRRFLKSAAAALLVGCAGRRKTPGPDASPVDLPITPDAPIIVIGAGIAGLAAATQLNARGFTDVLVLEARDRAGGRIHTDRSSGVPVDLGAAWVQYATDPSNPLLGLLAKLGITPPVTDWDKLDAFDEQTGAIPTATLEAGETAFEAALNTAGNTIASLADQDVSIASILDPLLAPQFTMPAQQRLLEFLVQYYVINEDAAELAELGAYDFSADAPGPSVEVDQLVCGFDALTTSLAQDLDIHFSEPVQRVAYDADGVTVTTTATSYRAAAVIVTLPVGVLRAGAVEFDPPLPPAKLQAIANIGWGMFEKAILIYDKPYWSTTANAFGYASATETPSPLWVNVTAATGAPVLVAMFTANGATTAAAMSDAELQALVTGQVATMFGASVPPPLQMIRTKWSTDPYALGAYTYPGLSPVDAAIAALAAPVGSRVLFAGEATDPEWYSFAHGAYLSGLRAANQLG